MLCPHFCLAASERERQRLNVMSLSESARRRSQSELQSLRSTVLLCFCHFGVLAQRSLLPLLSSAKDWGGSTHKHKHTATFRAIGNNQLWQRVSGPSSAGKGLFLLLVDDSNLVQGQMLTNGRQDSPVLGAGMECLSVWLFVDAGRHRLPACLPCLYGGQWRPKWMRALFLHKQKRCFLRPTGQSLPLQCTVLEPALATAITSLARVNCWWEYK